MTEEPYDHSKWVYETNVSRAERAHDTEREFGDKNNEAAINAANAAIRVALLINGGAAVSVLAFIGGLVSQKLVPVSELGKIASGLMWFTSGVALAEERRDWHILRTTSSRVVRPQGKGCGSRRM